MNLDKYDLTKKGKNWELKKEGGQRTTKVFDTTKEEAIKKSAEFLKSGNGGSLRIHKEDGTYQEERTYPRSADPRRSKG